jgi:hypothetical protein
MFDPEAMNRGLAEALGRHPLAVADQQAVRDFYESSLGRWIVTIETAVLKLPPDAALSAVEAGRRTSEVLSERRRAQYDRLWDATGDSATELARQVIWAIVLSASMSQRQGDVGPSWDEIDAAVEQMMPIALAEVKAQQLAQFAFVYQGLSDEDVEAYVSFLETPAARAYFTTSIAAMSEVIGEEMRRFGNALAARRPGAGA